MESKAVSLKVSVVIPNYNGASFLLSCLQALEKQTFKDFETIIVDNHSSDNSCELVSQYSKEVTIVKLDQNRGFSYAVNRGIELSKTDYVLLLNNDAFLEADFIQTLYDRVIQDPKCFSCCGKMIQYGQKDKIDDAGDLYTIIGWAFQRGNGNSVSSFDKDEKIFSSCAGAALYRKSAFQEIGMFEESFFAYLEDVDIGYRARLHGYYNFYCHKAICYHVGSATSGGKYSEFKVKLSARNNILLAYKNQTRMQFIINLPFLFMGTFVKYIVFYKKGFGTVYLNGTFEGIQMVRKKIIKKNVYTNVKEAWKLEKELFLNTFRYICYRFNYYKGS